MRWVRVSRENRCPVCDRDTWCTVAVDESNGAVSMIKCCRKKSDRALVGKDGVVSWIHADVMLASEVADRIKSEKKRQVAKLGTDALRQIAEDAAKRITKESLADLSRRLCVASSALRAVGVGLANFPKTESECWTFPSRDAFGNVTGIVCRFANGVKRSWPGGSNSGIFVTPNWWRCAGPVFCVEGPTDVAALVSVSRCAIGRCNNTGGADAVKRAVARRCPDKTVVVIGESDWRSVVDPMHDENCECCNQCYPGLFGARHVSKQIPGSLLAMPLADCKDVRDMLKKSRLMDFLRAIENRVAIECY